jgi:hypothetical protein
MKNFKKLLSIIIATIAGLAMPTLYLFSSGCSSGKNENSPQPCAGSKLAKNWLPPSERYGMAFLGRTVLLL